MGSESLFMGSEGPARTEDRPMIAIVTMADLASIGLEDLDDEEEMKPLIRLQDSDIDEDLDEEEIEAVRVSDYEVKKASLEMALSLSAFKDSEPCIGGVLNDANVFYDWLTEDFVR